MLVVSHRLWTNQCAHAVVAGVGDVVLVVLVVVALWLGLFVIVLATCLKLTVTITSTVPPTWVYYPICTVSD